jgi:hypothetical protein
LINNIGHDIEFGDAIDACNMLVALGRAVPAHKWLGIGSDEQDFSWVGNWA